jgi:hypothetical protein
LRQWGGREYDIDWHLGKFDNDTGTHDGEISWTVHEDAARAGTGAGGNSASTLEGQKAIVLEWIVNNPTMSKTSSVEALARAYSTHEKRFREAWSVLEGEKLIYETSEKLPFGDAGRTRKKAVWKVRTSGYVPGSAGAP